MAYMMNKENIKDSRKEEVSKSLDLKRFNKQNPNKSSGNLPTIRSQSYLTKIILAFSQFDNLS